MDEILNTIMGRIPRPSNPFASRRWKTFSVADWNAAEMEKGGIVEWREWKDKGNALFKAKDYAGARAMYGKARLLALGPYRSGAVKAWFDALQAAPAHTARRQVFDIEPLVGQVLKFLPRTFSRKSPLDGKPYGAPNNAAAVCSANISAAWLLEGEPENARKEARFARRTDPSYLKAHRRELAALQALHLKAMRKERQATAIRELKEGHVYPDRRQAMRKVFAKYATAIKEKNEELADYEQARAAYPTEALALLTAGWIGHELASFVYGPVRFLECVTWLRDGPLKNWRKCEARASLVPFQGGQVLMLSLCYTEADGMDNVINCLDWITVDNANGDLADKPPQGVASEQSLKYAPMRINMFIEELQEGGLEVVTVMLGQGLTEHVDLVDKTLREGSPVMKVPTFQDVLVYHAASTAASEDNGIPLNPDPRSYDAIQRRTKPEPDRTRLQDWINN